VLFLFQFCYSYGMETRVAMPTLITGDELEKLVMNPKVMEHGDKSSIEGVKYDFRLGDSFLKASFERPIKFSDLNATEWAKAKIEPGEVVFVMTHEAVRLPPDVIIILSQKRRISHEGISVLSGLCVDPGYEGYLLVGLHNFSSEPFRLEPGRKLI